jgi:hypothetical protein
VSRYRFIGQRIIGQRIIGQRIIGQRIIGQRIIGSRYRWSGDRLDAAGRHRRTAGGARRARLCLQSSA